MEHLDIFLLTSTIILGTTGSVYAFQVFKIGGHKFLLKLVWYIIFFNLFVLSQLFFVYAYVNILADYPALIVQRILLVHKFLDFLAQIGIAYYFVGILFDLIDKKKSTGFIKKFYTVVVFFVFSFLFGLIAYLDSSRLTLFIMTKTVSEFTFVTFLMGGAIYFLINARIIEDSNKRNAVTLFGGFYLVFFFVVVLLAMLLKNKDLYITLLSLLLNAFPIVWVKYVFPRYNSFSNFSLDNIDLNKIFPERYNISNREMEVLNLLIAGKSNKEIENILFISINTVKNHVSSLFNKLGINSRGQLMNMVLTLRKEHAGEKPMK